MKILKLIYNPVLRQIVIVLVVWTACLLLLDTKKVICPYLTVGELLGYVLTLYLITQAVLNLGKFYDFACRNGMHRWNVTTYNSNGHEATRKTCRNPNCGKCIEELPATVTFPGQKPKQRYTREISKSMLENKQ